MRDTASADRIAEKLHRERCHVGCSQPLNPSWLYLAEKVVEGDISYDEASEALLFKHQRVRGG